MITPGATEGSRAGAWRWPALAMFAVGYGANQFVPLLVAYRTTLGLSDTTATAIFGVYALGLIPGLVAGGRASDAHGRRRLMIAFAALSLVATAVLITGQWGVPGLYAGRFLTGVHALGSCVPAGSWTTIAPTALDSAVPCAFGRISTVHFDCFSEARPRVTGMVGGVHPGFMSTPPAGRAPTLGSS